MRVGIEIPDDFLSWLLHTSLEASLLIALILAVQWGFQDRLSPRWRFALWWLVVLRLMMPVSIESSASLLNWLPREPAEAQPVAAEPGGAQPSVTEVASKKGASGSDPDAARSEAMSASPPREAAEPATVPPPKKSSAIAQPSWKMVAFGVWLTGAGLLAAVLAGLAFRQYRRIRLLPQVTAK